MKRLLTLLALLTAASLALAGSAAATKSPPYYSLVKISGDTGFFQPKQGQVVMKSFRTHKIRTFKLPTSDAISDDVIRASSHALVFADTLYGSSRRLSIAGAGVIPRILERSDPADPCAAERYFIPLQIDEHDTVSALTWNWSWSCPGGDPYARQVTRYYRDGRVVTIPLPTSIAQLIYYSPSPTQVSIRGNDLFVAGDQYGGNNDAAVYNIKSSKTIWHGKLPPAEERRLPVKNVVWSSEHNRGHWSRATLFNYVTRKRVTINIPHPRGLVSCGRFTLLASGQYLEVYNQHGHRVLHRKARNKNAFPNGQAICSGRWAYVPIASKKSRSGHLMIHLSKLR